jgi:hypothetical protein
MPRDVVNVILDRVIDQRGSWSAPRPRPRCRRRACARPRAASSPPATSSRRANSGARPSSRSLAETSRHAKAAIAAAHDSLQAECRAVRAFGSHRLREIPALKNADVMARRSERKGTVGGAP